MLLGQSKSPLNRSSFLKLRSVNAPRTVNAPSRSGLLIQKPKSNDQRSRQQTALPQAGSLQTSVYSRGEGKQPVMRA